MKRLMLVVLLFATLLGLLVISAYPAEASTIEFSGTALGSFNGAPLSSTATLGGLTFAGSTFVAETDKYGRVSYLGPAARPFLSERSP